MDFSHYLSRAWQVTWKHKVLWIFGLLAADAATFSFNFGGGGGGGGGGAVPTPVPGAPPAPPAPPPFPGVSSPADAVPWLLLACCVFIVVVAFFLLGLVMRGGLIGGIRQADEQGAITFSEAWNIGTQYFGRMFGLWLTPLLVMFILFCALLNPLLWCLLCILPIIGIIVQIVVHFAQFAVVLEDMRVVDALRRGIAVLRANLMNALILGIIMFVITVVVVVLIAIPIAAAAAALVVPFFVTASSTGAAARGPDFFWLAVLGICFVCYLPVLLVASAVFKTWNAAVWTLAYRDFAANTPALAVPVAPAPPPPQPAPDAGSPPVMPA